MNPAFGMKSGPNAAGQDGYSSMASGLPLRALESISSWIVTPFVEVASNPLEVSIMSKLAIWAEVEAKPGKEQAVTEFLKSAQGLAEKEQGTLTWYAVKLGGAKFGIFDTFAVEKGREAHLNGEIAKALFGKAQELFVKEPQVHKIEILAAKVPGGAKAYGA
jgi:quinol monooxygenase YgiN